MGDMVGSAVLTLLVIIIYQHNLSIMPALALLIVYYLEGYGRYIMIAVALLKI
jgi:hypothetical protein